MRYMWKLSEKMTMKNKDDQTRYFLALNVIACCLTALLLTVLGNIVFYHKPMFHIDQFSVTMLLLGIVVGLFGGAIFVLRKD